LICFAKSIFSAATGGASFGFCTTATGFSVVVPNGRASVMASTAQLVPAAEIHESRPWGKPLSIVGWNGYARLDALLKGGNTGTAVVVPGKSAQSVLLDYVSGRVEGMEMPPMPKRDKFAALTKDEVELVRAWIEQGAVWPADVILNSKRK
jgi:hypothetical protein